MFVYKRMNLRAYRLCIVENKMHLRSIVRHRTALSTSLRILQSYTPTVSSKKRNVGLLLMMMMSIFRSIELSSMDSAETIGSNSRTTSTLFGYQCGTS